MQELYRDVKEEVRDKWDIYATGSVGLGLLADKEASASYIVQEASSYGLDSAVLHPLFLGYPVTRAVSEFTNSDLAYKAAGTTAVVLTVGLVNEANDEVLSQSDLVGNHVGQTIALGVEYLRTEGEGSAVEGVKRMLESGEDAENLLDETFRRLEKEDLRNAEALGKI